MGISSNNVVGGLMGGPFVSNDAIGMVLGGPTYMSYKQGKKANALQEEAIKQATAASKATADAATQAANRANQKRPNAQALLEANQKPGQSGTMLTGPWGLDPTKLQLGKTTLLGGGG